MGNDISLEPLANRGNSEGQGALVTGVAEIGAMSNRTAITVTDVAQEITIGSNKVTIEIQNTGTNPIYVGGSGVDSANGFTMYQDDVKIFNKVKPTFSFYAICGAGLTSTLRILEYA